MEELKLFDIVSSGRSLFVVVESEHLPSEVSVVVTPLIRDYPVVPQLNPTIRCDGQELILATRLIGSARRGSLRRVGTVLDQSDRITRALDVLLGGF